MFIIFTGNECTLFRAVLAQQWYTIDTGSLEYDSCYTTWYHPRNIARPGTGVSIDTSTVNGNRPGTYPTMGYYCNGHHSPFFTDRSDPDKWWQLDMKKPYHLERILILSPVGDIYCKELTFRLGNDENPHSPANQIIYKHEENITPLIIHDIEVAPEFVGRYLSIASNSSFFFGIAAIQVITREEFTVIPDQNK